MLQTASPLELPGFGSFKKPSSVECRFCDCEEPLAKSCQCSAGLVVKVALEALVVLHKFLCQSFLARLKAKAVLSRGLGSMHFLPCVATTLWAAPGL